MMRDALSNFGFLLQWMMGAAFALFASLVSFVVIFLGGSFVLMYLSHQHPENISAMNALIYSSVIYSLMGLAMGLIYGSVQKGLLRQKTNEPWRGWLIASAVGGVLGVDLTMLFLAGQLVPYLHILVLPPPEALFWIGLQVSTLPLGILAFAQMFILWQHVRGAWVWVLANLVAGLVLFSLISAGAFTWATTPLWTIAIVIGLAVAPAIVTGFAMVWLINMNWRGSY